MASVLEQVRQLRDEEISQSHKNDYLGDDEVSFSDKINAKNAAARAAAYNKVLVLLEEADKARVHEVLRAATPPAKRKHPLPDHITGHGIEALDALRDVRRLILSGEHHAPFLLVWLDDYECLDASVFVHSPLLPNSEWLRRRLLLSLANIAGAAKGAALMLLERADRMHAEMERG